MVDPSCTVPDSPLHKLAVANARRLHDLKQAYADAAFLDSDYLQLGRDMAAGQRWTPLPTTRPR